MDVSLSDVEDAEAVLRRFQAEFEAAAPGRARARIVERFVAGCAHLALGPDSWLYPHWQQWRLDQHAKGSPHADRARAEARRMLAAVQRGVSAEVYGYVGGWLPGPDGTARVETLRLDQARQLLRQASQDPQLKRAYGRWREGRGDSDYDRYLKAIVRRTMRVLLDFDPTQPPDSDLKEPLRSLGRQSHDKRIALYQPHFDRFTQDVSSKGLSRALSALVAHLHRIRERDLH